MDTHSATDSQNLCPLCGEANACARAKDPQAEDCWCHHTPIPRALIDRIPAAQKNRSCICQRCVEQAQALSYSAT